MTSPYVLGYPAYRNVQQPRQDPPSSLLLRGGTTGGIAWTRRQSHAGAPFSYVAVAIDVDPTGRIALFGTYVRDTIAGSYEWGPAIVVQDP